MRMFLKRFNKFSIIFKAFERLSIFYVSIIIYRKTQKVKKKKKKKILQRQKIGLENGDNK